MGTIVLISMLGNMHRRSARPGGDFDLRIPDRDSMLDGAYAAATLRFRGFRGFFLAAFLWLRATISR